MVRLMLARTETQKYVDGALHWDWLGPRELRQRIPAPLSPATNTPPRVGGAMPESARVIGSGRQHAPTE